MNTIAVVTGANQGLGFALVEGLAAQLEPGDVVYLTGRNATRVAVAAQRVAGARAQVRPHVLDVRDSEAVDAFAGELRATHGGVDIVFSNHYARTEPDDVAAEVVSAYVDANNLGTTRILRAFAPILRDGGRLLVVASTLGTLNSLAPMLHRHFDRDDMTLDDVDAAMLRWRDRVIDGSAVGTGWPAFLNIPSKIGQVAAVRALARERRSDDEENGTLICAVCPGMIDTGASRPWFDMSAFDVQTPAQAAAGLVELALAPEVDPRFSGELVRSGEVLAWRPGALAG